MPLAPVLPPVACPQCKTYTRARVTRTYRLVEGGTTRRRECNWCGFRWTERYGRVVLTWTSDAELDKRALRVLKKMGVQVDATRTVPTTAPRLRRSGTAGATTVGQAGGQTGRAKPVLSVQSQSHLPKAVEL